jgi:hypothetical protein
MIKLLIKLILIFITLVIGGIVISIMRHVNMGMLGALLIPLAAAGWFWAIKAIWKYENN